MKKKIIIGIAIIALVLIISSIAIVAVIAGNNETSEQKYIYECNSVVKANLFTRQPYIDSVSCENTAKKCGGLFSILDWLLPKGTIEMWDNNGKIASGKWDLGILSGGKDTVTLKGCSTGNSIKIKIYDQDGQFIEAKNG